MSYPKKILVALIPMLFLVACDNKPDAKTNSTKQVSASQGKEIFENNCLRCHGEKAKGLVKDWRKPLANGAYPAPPLNGTAHAWHHPPSVLLESINNGGTKNGGGMPAFKDTLSNSEKIAVLEYIFSLWPQKIQDQYNKRFK